MDIVFIHDLVINTIIGVYPHEQAKPQKLILDIELAIDIKKAALTDNIADTIDYGTLSNWIIQITQPLNNQIKFNLVETLAEFLCKNIIETFNVPWIKIKITKPYAITTTKHVGVIIERRAQDYNKT